MSMKPGSAPKGEPRPTPSIADNVMDQFSLKGRTCVVNGASSGIGASVITGFAEAGASHIALWYNSNPAAEELAKELENKFGCKAKAWKVSVEDPVEIDKALQEVKEWSGRVDVVVANAGMGNSKRLIDMSIEEFKKLSTVNFDGVVYLAKYAGTIFEQQGFGNFIITSSISAHIVNVPIDQPIYNATKAAVTHLGKSLAREWREFARVNIVSPGFFDTKMGMSPQVRDEGLRMTTLGRQGDVKEIKALFLYLASDASTYVTGADYLIDGGYVLP